MIKINTEQYGYDTEQFSFDMMLTILRDELIPNDYFIEIVTCDGLKAAVRKKDIVSIEEVENF